MHHNTFIPQRCLSQGSWGIWGAIAMLLQLQAARSREKSLGGSTKPLSPIHHLPSLETSGILLSFSPAFLVKGPTRLSLPLRWHRSLRKRRKNMASQTDSNPRPEGDRRRGQKERERERERCEVGDGRGPCLIFNRLRHKCSMIHFELATWIRWKLIKTIPHFSALKTS